MRSIVGIGIVALGCAAQPHASPAPPPAAIATVPEPTPSTAVTPRKLDYSGFRYTKLQKSPGQVPARFSGRLPTSLAEFEDPDDFLPLAQTGAAMCRGEPRALSAFLEALRTAAQAGPIEGELALRFQFLPDDCESPVWCNWLTTTISSEKDARVRQELFSQVQNCGISALPLIERADTPDEAVLEFYRGFGNLELPFTPRLANAIRKLAKGRRGRDLRDLTMALFRVKAPEAVTFVEKWQAATEPASRPWLALGLFAHPSPKAQQLVQAACSALKDEDDAVCEPPQWAPPTPPAGAALQQLLVGGFVQAKEWLSQNPGQERALRQALQGCVLKAEPDQALARARCLGDLAAQSWSDASAVVAKLRKQEREELVYSQELLAALLKFASFEGLVAHLREQGLVPADYAAHALDSGSDARQVMIDAKRMSCFDAETDRFPNQHDALLAELAAMTAGALDGVVFEEVAPSLRQLRGAADPSDYPYLLVAYMDGSAYRLTADNLGDWFDVAAVQGMLNSLLRERRSPFRFVGLDGGGQDACLATGPAPRLVELARDGLLQVDRGEPGTGVSFDQAQREAQEAMERLHQLVQPPKP